MFIAKTLRMILVLIMMSFVSNAQTTLWGRAIGGAPSGDRGHATRVAPNGNVFVTGAFYGTTDLDPGPGVYNITSSGGDDIFLACYSPTGDFVWGFRIGGADKDAGRDIDFDAQGNVFLIGYFRGQNVDFDPGVGVSTLSDNGLNGGTSAEGGDGFIAKYSSTGVHQWSYNVGGDFIFDYLDCLAVDDQGDVYFGGTIVDAVDIDPSPAVVTLNGINGKSYLIKYTGAGQLVWGKSFLSPGGAAVNCGVLSMRIVNSKIYICGFWQYTADFDPGPGTVSATASNYDPYVAIYDLDGNYLSADPIGAGSGYDLAREITVDPSGSMYVIGGTTAGTTAMTFGGSMNVAAPGGGNNDDIFFAKYSPTGTLLWAKMLGGPGNDYGFSITHADGFIYCTGSFSGTVDFDPSPAVSNLTSAGGLDMFVAKYDLNGNYICAFRAGNAGTDQGWGINPDAQNNIYVSGIFQNTVDFDPSIATYNIGSTSNSEDAFLVKYNYSAGVTNYYSLTGDTICPYETPYVTLTDTANAGPFTVTISDGFNSYTYPNIQSGVPFALSPVPSATTTYTWSTGGLQNACLSSGGSGSFTIVVRPQPTANAGPDVTDCTSSFVQLQGSGGSTYTWTPGVVLTNPNSSNPTLTVADTTITFTMITTNVEGCSDTDQVTVSTHTGIAVANAGPDTSVCAGAPIQLQGSGNGSFQWYPPAGLSNPAIADPTYTGNSTGTLNLVVTDQYNCKDTDQVVISMYPSPTANAGPDVQACAGDTVQLQGTGGGSYSWYPNSGMTGSNTASPTVIVTSPTTYYVTTTNVEGCSDTDAVVVSAISVPMPAVSPAQRVCSSDSVTIYVAGGSNHFWFPDDNISSTGGDTVVVWPGSSTTYYVVVTEPACGYIDTLAIDVDVNPIPNVQIDRADPVDCAKPYGQLAASGAKNYVWTPANSLNDPAIAAPLSFAKEPTWYTVMGISEDGCVGYDSALVNVISDNMDGFFLPTVFSPNDDGKNDCYRILLPPGISEYELHIYNRWGNNVFNADGPSDCWDGTYNGEPCDVGVYMYYYILKSPVCGVKKEGKGDITLLR